MNRAAEIIAIGIKKDLCDQQVLNMTWTIAEYLDIVMSKLQNSVAALTANNTIKVLTKEEIIEYVIRESEKECFVLRKYEAT